MAGAQRYWLDRLVASDPGFARLRTAGWALLTTGIGTALLLALAHVFGVPQPVALGGAAIGLVSTVAVQDPTRAAQEVTLAWVALVAGLVMVLGSVLAGNLLASGIGFVAVTVAGFEAQRFGVRGRALGSMAYQTYFYALLLKPAAHDWAWVLASTALGCAVAWVVRFWILPERAPALLKRELAALRAGVLVLLHELAARLEQPHSGRRARRPRISLDRLNDLSLQLEQRLARFAAQDAADGQRPLRDRVLSAEIAAETVYACASAAASAEAGSADARRRLAQLLRDFADALRRGDAPRVLPDRWQPDANLLAADRRWRFAHALRALLDAPPWQGALPPLADTTAPAAPPAQPKPAPHASPWRWLADEPTRRALQAGTAAALAIVAGRLLSADHWYWAVFGALVVFTRAGTRGQAIVNVWRRMLASVAGLALGLAVAELVHGQFDLQFVLLFVFIAIGFYAFQAFQPVYVAILTAMLAMLYELIGEYSPGLLLLRLEETAAGAAAAMLSATWVLPAHTRAQSDQESVQLLREAAKLLRGVFAQPEPARPSEAVRALDRRLQALRQVLGPVTARDAPTPKEGHRQRLHALAVVVYCLRHFYNLLASEQGPERAALGAPAGALAERLDACAEALASGGALPRFGPLPPDPAPDGEGAQQADTVRIAGHWLVEANEALERMP